MNKLTKSFLSVALFGIAAGFLVGCSSNGKENNKQGNQPSQKTEELNANIELNSVEEAFETHKAEQLAYLTKEDYKTLSTPKGKDSNGNSIDYSKPEKLNLSWTVNTDEEISEAKLCISEDENFSSSIEYDIKNNGQILNTYAVNNLKVGATYYWKVVLKGNNDLTKESNVETFSTKDTGTRFIDIDGISNVRDLGGYTVAGGKKTKQGLIYRGSGWNKQNFGTKAGEVIDEEDIERAKEKPYGKLITDLGEFTIRNELKIKTEIDVRGYENYEYIDTSSQYYLNPSPVEVGGLTDGRGILLDVDYIVNPIDTNHDKIYKTAGGKAAVKKFFTTLADEASYPIYFHCAQGKDRTGFIGYVLGGLLGMDKVDMCRDFLLSNISTVGTVSLDYFLNFSTPSSGGSRYDYGAYFDGYKVDDMDQLTASTLQGRVTEYLLSCGLTQQQLDKIIDINVEK